MHDQVAADRGEGKRVQRRRAMHDQVAAKDCGQRHGHTSLNRRIPDIGVFFRVRKITVRRKMLATGEGFF